MAIAACLPHRGRRPLHLPAAPLLTHSMLWQCSSPLLLDRESVSERASRALISVLAIRVDGSAQYSRGRPTPLRHDDNKGRTNFTPFFRQGGCTSDHNSKQGSLIHPGN